MSVANWACKKSESPGVTWTTDTRHDWADRKKTWEDKQWEKQLKQAFDLYDLDGSGTISVEEMLQLVKALGIPLEQHAIEDIVREVDDDGSGEIEFIEFRFEIGSVWCRQLMGRYQRSTVESVKATWHIFDRDGDGSVSQEEMASVLASCGLNLAPWEIMEMVRECDLDNDGIVTFEEFCAGFETLPWTRAQRLGENIETIRGTWKLFDKDGDGTITLEEMRKVFDELGANVNDFEVEKMLSSADVNKDGRVDFGEFLDAWNRVEWTKARLVGVTQSSLEVFAEKQRQMYEHQQIEERFETGISSSLDTLMKRRWLRRDPEVKAAIDHIWGLLKEAITKGGMLSQEVYSLFSRKYMKLLEQEGWFIEEDEEDSCDDGGLGYDDFYMRLFETIDQHVHLAKPRMSLYGDVTQQAREAHLQFLSKVREFLFDGKEEGGWAWKPEGLTFIPKEPAIVGFGKVDGDANEDGVGRRILGRLGDKGGSKGGLQSFVEEEEEDDDDDENWGLSNLSAIPSNATEQKTGPVQQREASASALRHDTGKPAIRSALQSNELDDLLQGKRPYQSGDLKGTTPELPPATATSEVAAMLNRPNQKCEGRRKLSPGRSWFKQLPACVKDTQKLSPSRGWFGKSKELNKDTNAATTLATSALDGEFSNENATSDMEQKSNSMQTHESLEDARADYKKRSSWFSRRSQVAISKAGPVNNGGWFTASKAAAAEEETIVPTMVSDMSSRSDDPNGGRSDVNTTCQTKFNHEDTQGKSVQLCIGHRVKVSRDFTSLKDKVQVKAGWEGEVVQIDSDGNFLIDFNDKQSQVWAKGNNTDLEQAKASRSLDKDRSKQNHTTQMISNVERSLSPLDHERDACSQHGLLQSGEGAFHEVRVAHPIAQRKSPMHERIQHPPRPWSAPVSSPPVMYHTSPEMLCPRPKSTIRNPARFTAPKHQPTTQSGWEELQESLKKTQTSIPRARSMYESRRGSSTPISISSRQSRVSVCESVSPLVWPSFSPLPGFKVTTSGVTAMDSISPGHARFTTWSVKRIRPNSPTGLSPPQLTSPWDRGSR